MRIAVLETAKTDQVDQTHDLFLPLDFGDTRDFETMADVSPHRAPRQDRKFLEYYSALAARLGHQFTVAVNRAFGRTDESGHRLEQCGLAAATGPDQSDEFAGANLQVDYAGRLYLSLIHISEPTRLGMISYAVFC